MSIAAENNFSYSNLILSGLMAIGLEPGFTKAKSALPRSALI
jgi:hypothetical protein